MQPSDPHFESRIRESFARQGIMGLLGARLAKVEPGLVVIELPFRKDLSQQHGFFHAGVVSTIMDSAGGYAGYTLFPAGASVLTVEFKVNLLAPADGDRLVATGRVVKAGRTVTVTELSCDVYKDGRAKACAWGSQTLMRVEGRANMPVPG